MNTVILQRLSFCVWLLSSTLFILVTHKKKLICLATLSSDSEKAEKAEKAEIPNKLTPTTPVAYDLGLVN